jgi:hypothetical protein
MAERFLTGEGIVGAPTPDEAEVSVAPSLT